MGFGSTGAWGFERDFAELASLADEHMQILTVALAALAVATACSDSATPTLWPKSDARATSVSSRLKLPCANPRPEWIWCDDFEQDRTSSYFEYQAENGSFSREVHAGLRGSTSMRARWRKGQVGAGSLKLAFGRNPSGYMRPVDDGTATYRELYWRVFMRSDPQWTPNGSDKFSRAIVIARDDWSEAAIGHVWGGSAPSTQAFYMLDPVRGTDESGNVVTNGYNDFANFSWLGVGQGTSPVFDRTGPWYCVEAHMRLNDPGQSNGVFELWVDGKLDARRTGLNWLGSYADYGINALFLENFINNGAPHAQVRDYDELAVSTRPIGCGQAP